MADRLLLDPPSNRDECRRLQARVEINRAVTLRQCSALRAAEAAIKRAVQLSEGFSDLQAETYMVLASLHSFDGVFSLARLEAEHAVALSESGSSKLQGQAWNQKGNVLFRAGDYEPAREAFLHARKYALMAEDKHHVASAEGNIGACLRKLGQPGKAGERLKKAIEVAREIGDPLMESTWLIELGEIAFDAGDLDDAERYALAALRIARPSDRVLTVFRAEWLRHLIARKRTPHEPDTQRINQLKKLYPRVRDHASLEPIREFRRSLLETGEEDSPHD